MTRPSDVRPPSWWSARTLPLAFILATFAASSARAAAPPDPVDVEACVTYDQSLQDDGSIRVELHSSCSAKLSCKVQWQLSCSPRAPERRDARSFTLPPGEARSTRIQTAACRSDDWELSDLTWSCVQR